MELKRKEILLTGGVGDVLICDNVMPTDYRKQLKTIYWSTRSAKVAIDLFEHNPEYNHVRHIQLWDNDQICPFYNWQGVKNKYPDLPELDDWSIANVFPAFRNNELPFTGSTFLKHQLTDISHFDLPDDFIYCQGSTPFNTPEQREQRDLKPIEWEVINTRLERDNKVALVLDEPRGIHPPKHKRLIDLVGKTTLLEAIEILKRASGFWGIASCICTLAAQLFDKDDLYIKGPEMWFQCNRNVYLMPHIDTNFVFTQFLDPQPNQSPLPIDNPMQIKLLKHFIYGLAVFDPGTIIDVDVTIARDMINQGRAIVAPKVEPEIEPIKKAVTKQTRRKAVKQ
jgi:hypothetical protein